MLKSLPDNSARKWGSININDLCGSPIKSGMLELRFCRVSYTLTGLLQNSNFSYAEVNLYELTLGVLMRR